MISLATRPVLRTLARVLAEAWPDDVPRDELVLRAFRLKLADESHRARLRVEIGRLRKLLRTMTGIAATPRGFVLVPHGAQDVAVLVQPEDKHADMLAFLADGESWSTSALARALGASQRTVQRSLDSLALAGKVRSFGRGRAQRWMTPSRAAGSSPSRSGCRSLLPTRASASIRAPFDHPPWGLDGKTSTSLPPRPSRSGRHHP